jgi:hypothetical protein
MSNIFFFMYVGICFFKLVFVYSKFFQIPHAVSCCLLQVSDFFTLFLLPAPICFAGVCFADTRTCFLLRVNFPQMIKRQVFIAIDISDNSL